MKANRGQPISGSTGLVGIIGDPVQHSLSPALHNAAFAHEGLDMAYVPLHVRAERLKEAVRGLRALGFVGANVTVPHKRAVAPLLDELVGDAAALGAVNTILVRGEILEGYNTDVEGFTEAYRARAGETFGGTVLLLGSGGAAHAAALGLLRLGCRSFLIVNRTPARAEQLAGLIRALAADAVVDMLPLHELSSGAVRQTGLVVNATALGMDAESKVPDAVADNVGVDQIVYDIVYAPAGTTLLRAARARGATTIDGLEMLIRQAAAAFSLWTGRPAPIDHMRREITK